MQNSLEAYTMKYNENGYGLLFPDGHVVGGKIKCNHRKIK